LDLDMSTTLGSLAAAALAGLVSGWYPARRAAALDVVDAMRQE
jgi:ABC-type antimicrobial peptide transport system permease subunit